MKRGTLRESDLYPPLRAFLEPLGYQVRAEVHHCDIAAVRGDELLVVEMKLSLNLTLLVQAVSRQRLTSQVYIAIPRPRRAAANHRGILSLLRRLGLGLLVVDFRGREPQVTVKLDPSPATGGTGRRNTRARRGLLAEIAGRSLELNIAGTGGRPIVTAYRERALRLACCLVENGPLPIATLKRLGTGDGTGAMLYKNHYGWFDRIARGVYAATEQARQDLAAYPELVSLFTTATEDQAEDRHTPNPITAPAPSSTPTTR